MHVLIWVRLIFVFDSDDDDIYFHTAVFLEGIILKSTTWEVQMMLLWIFISFLISSFKIFFEFSEKWLRGQKISWKTKVSLVLQRQWI